jgi:hypothetical protein
VQAHHAHSKCMPGRGARAISRRLTTARLQKGLGQQLSVGGPAGVGEEEGGAVNAGGGAGGERVGEAVGEGGKGMKGGVDALHLLDPSSTPTPRQIMAML